MSVVNFTLPKPLEQKVNTAIKDQGFASKAEFFRFAALYFVHKLHQTNTHQDEAFERTMNTLASALRTKVRGKKLPSLEEQFANLR